MTRNQQVERALLSRALGTTVTETRTEYSEKGGEKTVTTVKEVAPDISAQVFWLKNRCPDQWKDKPEPQRDKPENDLVEVILEVLSKKQA